MKKVIKRQFLKSKNIIAKLALTILGFTLAASQCLAQYMAIRPMNTIQGKLKGITDTISRFRIVINNSDTLYSTWKNKYTFEYNSSYRANSITIAVSEDVEEREQKYSPVSEIVAIKPDDEGLKKEVAIALKKKVYVP